MKKIKAIAIVSGVLTVLQLIPFIPAIWNVFITSVVEFKSASAIGIIGYADGPTSVVVASVFNPAVLLLWARCGFFLLCAVTFIVSMVLYFKKRKQSRND